METEIKNNQTMGVSVELTAWQSHLMHKSLVSTYNGLAEAQKALYKLTHEIGTAKTEVYCALHILESKIATQEEKSQIFATTYKILPVSLYPAGHPLLDEIRATDVTD